MATLTVKQTGGDYATLASAFANANASDTISIEGTWTIADTAVTDPADANLTVTADASSKHPGYYDTSTNHYRLTAAFGDEAIEIGAASGLSIDGIAIYGTGAQELVKSQADITFTVKNCILACNETAGSTGIECGIDTVTCNVENTIIYGCEHAGICAEPYSTGYTQTYNVNSCTIYDCAQEGATNSCGVGMTDVASGSTVNFNVYNTVVLNCSTSNAADYQNTGAGTKNWDIHTSIDSDNSITSCDGSAVGCLASRTASDSDTPGTGDWVVFEDITTAIPGYDLRLKTNAENDAEGMHSTGSGAGMSMPSTDIVGTDRTAPYDCGAYRVSLGGLEISECNHGHTADTCQVSFDGALNQVYANHSSRSNNIDLIVSSEATPVVEQVVAITEAVTQAQQDTIGTPEGWSTPTSGNMLLVFVAAVPTSTDTAVTSPAGWTQVAENSITGSRYQGLYWKVSDGTESTITFQRIGSGDVQCGAVAVELSGVDTSAGTDQFTAQLYNQTSATSRAYSTSITPNNDNAVFIAFWNFEDNDVSAYTYTNSYTIGDYDEDNSAADNSIGAGYKVVSDGNFHTTTIGATGGAADENYGYHVVIDSELTDTGTTLNLWDRLHAHTADNVVLDVGGDSLTIPDASHSHSADSPTLTANNITLTIADSTSAHAAESPALTANDITLAVADSTHAHAAESPTLTANDITLAVDDSTSAHAAESPTLTANDITLTVADSTHAHAADALVLTMPTELVVGDGAHAHAAESPALTANDITLSLNDSGHSHAAESPTLTANDITLSVADGAHAHAAESLILDTTLSIAIADGAHSHSAETPTLTANDITLSVADSTHAHAADNVTLSLADNNLVIAGSGHSHAAESLTLTANDITLSVDGALNAHAAESPTLTANDITLAVDDGAHTHSAEAPTLTTAATISVADSAHALTSDSPALTANDITLSVSDGAHAHAAESPVLVIAGQLGIAGSEHALSSDSVVLTADAITLSVNDGAHAHAAEEPVLTEIPVLAIAEAVHAVTSDEVTFSDIGLAVADAVHAHAAESPALTLQDITLIVADALSGHVADSPTLTVVYLLVIAEALHSVASDAATLTAEDISLAVNDALHAHTADPSGVFQGERLTPAHRRIEVVADDRLAQILEDPRIAAMLRQDRVIDVWH